LVGHRSSSFTPTRPSVRRYESLGRVAYTPAHYVVVPFRDEIGNDLLTFHTAHLAAMCSSSRSEIMRLCVQMRGGLIGRVCVTPPDSSWLTVHLPDSK
jgi:hypothetical protein